MSFKVKRVVTGHFQENTFFIWEEDSSHTLVIDPGAESDLLIEKIDYLHLEPIAILITHAHLDHIGAVNSLKENYSIPFFLHKQEAENLNMYEHQCQLFGLSPGSTPPVDRWFDNETVIKIQTFVVKLLPAPGHSPGGTCFILDNHVFVGDTLFSGSVGRTDLPGGDWKVLENSLVRIMEQIPQESIIHSGHGPDTTLKTEIVQNPFLIPLRNRVNCSP